MSILTKGYNDYREIVESLNSFIDVIFIIDGHEIPSIKPILCLKNRVFRAMFSGNFKESQKQENSKPTEVVIKETTIDAFKTLIHFIYFDELLFKDDNDLQHICDVYQLSDRYEVLRLRKRVCNHFESIINLKDLTPISRLVFTLNIEELMAKVMRFIESNINTIFERDVKELKELNDSTNDRLLDVLTSDRFNRNSIRYRYFSDIKILRVGDNCFSVKRDVIFSKFPYDLANEHACSCNGINECNAWDCDQKTLPLKSELNDISFDAFKTFVGYLYFDKLVLKDDEDFPLIRDVCKVSKIYEQTILLETLIGNHLEDRITVENLEFISGIAFDFKIERLMKRLNDFTIENHLNYVQN